MTFELLFTEILDFFNIWVFVRTSANFAHLASSQAIELVDSGQTSENKSFCYKTQHSVIILLYPTPGTSTRFNSLPQFPRFPLGPTKRTLHFLTRASFTEAPAKTESGGFQTFISHLKFSMLYFISDLCFSFTWSISSFKLTEKLHTFSLWM